MCPSQASDRLRLCISLVILTYARCHHHHISTIIKRYQSSSTSLKNGSLIASQIRGGSTRVRNESPLEREGNSKDNENEERNSLLLYRMDQQHLFQLRSTFLSEALSSKGVKVGPNLLDVSTVDSERPPQIVDWDCSVSTRSNPKVGQLLSSLYSNGLLLNSL